MELRNYTPFAPIVFSAEDDAGTDMGVLAVRGTFRVMPGAALRPDPDQAPVRVADVYRGAAGASSVRWESDLAPLKPRADVHLDAVAYAPGGEPSASWTVGVRVARRDADGEPVRQAEAALRVTGPREWHRGLAGWRLEPPAPALRVPLTYERAYGGAVPDPEDPDRDVEYLTNPVGTGFFLPKHADAGEQAAPQTEWADEPVGAPGGDYAPAGLGPLARSWQPRLGLAGTFDAAWQAEHAPHLPPDFDFAHYNSAPPPLQAPGYLAGDETVTMWGLHARTREVSVCLPGYTLAALLRYQDGTVNAAPLRIDTLELDLSDLDPDEHRASLVWRTQFPRRTPLRVVEVRMELPETPPAPDAELAAHSFRQPVSHG